MTTTPDDGIVVVRVRRSGKVKEFFLRQVGILLMPPMRRLEIQGQTLDVEPM